MAFLACGLNSSADLAANEYPAVAEPAAHPHRPKHTLHNNITSREEANNNLIISPPLSNFYSVYHKKHNHLNIIYWHQLFMVLWHYSLDTSPSLAMIFLMFIFSSS
jgi:hypothetical protein